MQQYYKKNYRAVRVCGPVFAFSKSSTFDGSVYGGGGSSTCYKYTVWCIPPNSMNKNKAEGTFWELYDLGADPSELDNK